MSKEDFYQYLKDNVSWILPLMTTILFSGLNVIVAICNSVNSNNQRKIQNDSFCFQLYEKRLSVYESVKGILANVIANHEVTVTDINSFLKETKEVEFLFGDDIKETCSTTYEIIVNIHTNNKKIESNIKNNKPKNTYELLYVGELELFESLDICNEALTEQIKKYISFSGYTIK